MLKRSLSAVLMAAMLLAWAAWSAGPSYAAGLPVLRTETQSLILPVAHERCGVSSGNFARTCRPGSYNQCMRAAARGVAGITAALCKRRQSACSMCLDAMFSCFKRIGHASLATCDKCKSQFDVCYRTHWR